MRLNMVHSKEDSKEIVRIVSGEIWLNYFNNYLLKEGVITERMYWKMFVRILERTAQKEKELRKTT